MLTVAADHQSKTALQAESHVHKVSSIPLLQLVLPHPIMARPGIYPLAKLLSTNPLTRSWNICCFSFQQNILISSLKDR